MVQEENNLQLWSTVLGWTYFLAWSISFYQQPWLNFKRASVRGLSAEFLFYNVTGFLFCESLPVRFRPRHSLGLFAAQTQPTRLPSTCCRKTLGCRCQVQFGSRLCVWRAEVAPVPATLQCNPTISRSPCTLRCCAC